MPNLRMSDSGALQNLNNSAALNNSTSFYQPNPNSVPQRKQQDLYKVYLNYVPNQVIYN